MKSLRHFIKLAVISGLVTQLMMAAFMVTMALDRAILKSAQDNFYAAFSQTAANAKSGFSLCLTDDSSEASLENCLICDALLGADVYTLPVLASFSAPLSVAVQLEPVALGFRALRQTLADSIRAPPSYLV